MKLAVYLGMAAFLCAGSLLWSGQVEHLDTKKRKMLQDLFLLAAGALFLLVATCRYGIGYDYFNYQTLYEQLGPMSVSQLLQDHVGQEFIGYSIFTRLMYLLGLSYRQLLLVVNLLLTAIVVWFVRRFSPLPWLGLHLYLTLQVATSTNSAPAANKNRSRSILRFLGVRCSTWLLHSSDPAHKNAAMPR